MKTKTILISMLLCLSFVLTGCAGDEENQIFAWPLATASPEDTVTQLFAEKFADEVSELSGGKMKIQVYANSTLGGDRELLESCQSGDIPFVVQTTAPQVSFMPELAVFDLPCAYDTIEDVRAAIDDEEFNSQISDIYIKSGYRLLGMADQNFRVMSTNKEIKSIDDFKGQKIRTMENSNHLAFWKAIGANPTPMAFAEVYIGLQQNTIDAQENPYEVISSSRFYEVQDYVVTTNHLPHLLSLIVSDDFFGELSEDEQNILMQAAETAKVYAREMADERAALKVEEIKEGGAEMIELSPEIRQQIREASKPVYDSIREAVGDDIVDAYIGSAE